MSESVVCVCLLGRASNPSPSILFVARTESTFLTYADVLKQFNRVLEEKTALLAKVGWRAPDFHQQSSFNHQLASFNHQLASLFHQLASLAHQLALLTLLSPTFINIFTNSHLIFTNSHFDDITTSLF
jgi:hypothetical protein